MRWVFWGRRVGSAFESRLDSSLQRREVRVYSRETLFEESFSSLGTFSPFLRERRVAEDCEQKAKLLFYNVGVGVAWALPVPVLA